MKRNVILSCAAVVAGLAATASPIAADPIIAVGPNIQVSNDGDAAHVELMVAANPTNAKNVIGTAITFVKPGTDVATKTYSSSDGGYTWTDSVTKEIFTAGSGDPQITFGPDGTAYYTALVNFTHGSQLGDQMMLYRSSDGGKTWSAPYTFTYDKKYGSFDHEQIAVDQGSARFKNRVYIGVLDGPYPEYDVSILHSSDGGRSFSKPIVAASGRKITGINVNNLVILRDGTLVVPYMDFPYEESKSKKITYTTGWTVTSADGGLTFSKPRRVLRQHIGTYDKMMARFRAGRFDSTTFPDYAADTTDGAHRNRMYVVWADEPGPYPRVMVSHSDDRGGTWSAPQPIDKHAPAWSAQYQPEVVVNKNGVVGVVWFDTRESANEDRYREYFSASLDGGETFLAPVAVSSAASLPRGPGNVRLIPFANDRQKPYIGLRFMSAYTRYSDGGDYMGLTTDADGSFHPLWADARSGTYQIYSAKVAILDGASDKPNLASADITKKVGVAFGTIAYDANSGEYLIPVQLQNNSPQPIYGPLRVTVQQVIDPYDIEYHRVDQSTPYAIVNASNGKTGVGAVFDYGKALGTLGVLEPGAKSESVIWRVKMPPIAAPYIGVRVDGYVAQ